MVTILLILIPIIIAILDSIVEVIRVPVVMKASKFKKFVGHKYIDPEVSWVNKNHPPKFIPKFIWVCFSDFYHLLRFFIRLLWFALAITYSNAYIFPSDWHMLAMWWILYAFIFELFYWHWRKL